MQKCKITVLKCNFDEELIREYGVKDFTKCQRHKEGQEFITGYGRPEGLCDEAWKGMNKFVFALAHGADNLYDGKWVEKSGVAITSCSDGLRNVIFKVERMDED